MRRRLEHHSRQVLMEIARDTGSDLPKTTRRAAGDPQALRGVPVTSVPGGIGGAMADTQPERALIAKERRRERRYDA